MSSDYTRWPKASKAPAAGPRCKNSRRHVRTSTPGVMSSKRSASGTIGRRTNQRRCVRGQKRGMPCPCRPRTGPVERTSRAKWDSSAAVQATRGCRGNSNVWPATHESPTNEAWTRIEWVAFRWVRRNGTPHKRGMRSRSGKQLATAAPAQSAIVPCTPSAPATAPATPTPTTTCPIGDATISSRSTAKQ